MFLPGYFSAAFLAPTIAAPDEIPIPIPVERKKFLVSSIASSLVTVNISSIYSFLKFSGINPVPIPWILCGPPCPSLIAGDSAGSTAIDNTSGLFSFKYLATPVNVPPVPTPATKISILGTCSNISLPVVLW